MGQSYSRSKFHLDKGSKDRGAGNIDGTMYFKTLGQFAQHLQERLDQLNKVLVQSWKVHDTYTKNISKVKSNSRIPND